jgi:hypothetical protein
MQAQQKFVYKIVFTLFLEKLKFHNLLSKKCNHFHDYALCCLAFHFYFLCSVFKVQSSPAVAGGGE